MTKREIIYRLLYLALIEIRTEAYDIKNSKIFHLSDLLHNIPLKLERVLQGEGSYDEVMDWIQTRAQEKSCEQWLEKAVKDVQAWENKGE
jgi:hypothetical protein